MVTSMQAYLVVCGYDLIAVPVAVAVAVATVAAVAVCVAAAASAAVCVAAVAVVAVADVCLCYVSRSLHRTQSRSLPDLVACKCLDVWAMIPCVAF